MPCLFCFVTRNQSPGSALRLRFHNLGRSARFLLIVAMHSSLPQQARSAALFDPVSADLGPADFEFSEETPPQRILYVTPEIADYVKAGGLGEVSAALPRTLRQEYDARVLVPGYRQVLDNNEISVVARLRGVQGMPDCE